MSRRNKRRKPTGRDSSIGLDADSEIRADLLRGAECPSDIGL
jgi:hypothetical protein